MKRSISSFALGMLLFSVGCGGKQDDTVSSNSTSPTLRKATPTSTTSQIIPPTEIVAMFADSIRRGDRDTTNKLITEEARVEIAKQGIDLDPPGSPEASYKIGEFKFSDEDKDAGFVESFWIEPAAEGQPPVSTEVVWVLRLEDAGWRISGLAIDMGTDQPPAVVDFEDLESAVVDSETSTANAQEKIPARSTESVPAAQIAKPVTNEIRR